MFEEYAEIREKEIPINNLIGYKIIRLVGSTGSGKSQFMRYLLGTDTYKFPATATGKCTVAKIEVINYVKNADYSAVITFYDENFLNSKIKELLHLIIHNVLQNFESFNSNNLSEFIEDKMYSEFRNISNQTFKLNFLLKYDDTIDILKSLYNLIKNNIKIEDINNNSNLDEIYFDKIMTHKNNNFLSDIINIIIYKLEQILKDFNVYINKLGYNKNYSYIKKKDKSLISGVIIKSIKNKDDFFNILNIFYDNNIRNQGKILNTLVEGIRIIGNFIPNWYQFLL